MEKWDECGENVAFKNCVRCGFAAAHTVLSPNFPPIKVSASKMKRKRPE